MATVNYIVLYTQKCLTQQVVLYLLGSMDTLRKPTGVKIYQKSSRSKGNNNLF